MSARLSSPFHPLLLPLFPVLALLAANREHVDPAAGLRSLGVALLFGALLWALAGLLYRDARRGALLAAVAVLLWFSYGHAYMGLRPLEVFGEPLGRHRYLAPLGALLLLSAALLVRKMERVEPWNAALNAIAVAALLMPLLQLGADQVQAARNAPRAVESYLDPASGERFELAPRADAPDVYYIVLDAYGREDTLQQLIGFDNAPFLQGLEQLGFYVAHCAQSNYAQSELTLASTLNMAYLEDLGDGFRADRDDRSPLRPLIKAGLVRDTFENLGYEVVAFETGYPFSEWETADRYLRPDLSQIKGAGLLAGLNGFETLLLRSSAGLLLIDYADVLPVSMTPDYQFEVRAAREHTLFALDQLPELADSERPRFVFAHIVSPHRPFVFGPGGEARVPPNLFEWDSYDERLLWYRQGYRDQVQYLNQRLLPVLRALIEHSDPPPVIVLQADHGPEEGGSEDRMAILSAYYFGGQTPAGLYPTMTPVNNFRLILNHYFGAELPLLPDRSLHSAYNRPYDFQLIENRDCMNGGS